MRRAMVLAASVALASVSASCGSDGKYPSESGPQHAGARDVSAMGAGMIGTPNKNLHPALSHPKYSSEKEAGEFLADDDRVYFIRTRELTLVYPELILSLHHVINETIDDAPVAITQCRLTDSVALYSRLLAGEKLTLGSLGTVVYGNDVLYDTRTESWWTQLTGECFSGKHKGERLPAAPGLEQGIWREVRRLPYVNVVIPQGDVSNYRRFLEQMASSDAGVRAVEEMKKVDRRLEPLTPGLGVLVRGEARFYPLRVVAERGVINDEVGGWALLVLHDKVLGGARVFRRYLDGERRTFVRDAESLRDRETGSAWSADGNAIAGSLRGKSLEKPGYSRAYWFAWAAFHPDGGIFAPGEAGGADGLSSKTKEVR